MPGGRGGARLMAACLPYPARSLELEKNLVQEDPKCPRDRSSAGSPLPPGSLFPVSPSPGTRTPRPSRRTRPGAATPMNCASARPMPRPRSPLPIPPASRTASPPSWRRPWAARWYSCAATSPASIWCATRLDKNNCDVVMGVDVGDERVLISTPYYRTSYVLVTKAERGITTGDWEDQQIRDQTRFAVRFYSPAETMLKRIGRFEDNAAYMYSLVNFKSRRNQWIQVPGDRIVTEVASGEADVGIAFAPEVARYVKNSSTPLRMTVITRDIDRPNDTPIPMHYDQAIGVRKNDPALLKEINEALQKARPQIEQILTQEGIPLLEPNT
ncbi:methanol oxidation system protein MoxJ [Ancylobacter dichloromethanicus]